MGGVAPAQVPPRRRWVIVLTVLVVIDIHIDNVGLLVGDSGKKVKNILLTIDTTKEVVEEGQPVVKKYVTATFDPDADAEILGKYNLLRNVGGFSASDVVEAGIAGLWTSKEFKEKAALLKNVL